MCYIKEEFQEGVEYITCNKTSEDRMWIKLSSNFFGFKNDVYLCLVYISPTNVASRDSILSLLQEEIATFSVNNHIVLTGNFNARTGLLPDYIVMDSNQYVPVLPEYTVDTPVTRASNNKTTNSYGRELLDLCISSELRIVNGRVGSDKDKCDFSCHTPRGSSTVYYTIASVNILGNLTAFQVDELSVHSDHCPLSFQLSTDEGSMYQLRVQSGELFDEIVEKHDKMVEEIQPPSKALDKPLFFGQTIEEQLIESYSHAEFLNQLHSL